ncbi:DUF11 domain-containing protein [Sphingomonas sp. MMS12-HWE2-04]|uniref:DUF11 domain-containing protein n=1 Tax=Sphingomonas sp. MMS12-HWE2-04 TaxID=3234199 RepID=UPI00384B1BAE
MNTPRTLQGARRSALLPVAAFAVLMGATPALAQRAGTPIVNIATMDMEIDGTPARIASNRASLRVAERLDIGLAATTNAVATGQAAAPFTLTNAGNGNERFFLAGSIEQSSVTVRGFAIDTNGNGVLDAGDTLLDSATTPVLAPGQSIALLVLLTPDAMAAAGTLIVFARAATGSGAPGTPYAGRGDEGTDAIVGPTTAEANLRFGLASAPAPEATLTKTQTMVAMDGSAAARRGTTITYSLAAQFTGNGAARGAMVNDPIPTGTSYLSGSLTLDGVALSDAADGDAGSFDGAQIAVALGDIATPQTRTVQFKVTIQ